MAFSHFFQYRAARHLLGWGLVCALIGFLAWQDPAHARAGLLRSALLLTVAGLG